MIFRVHIDLLFIPVFVFKTLVTHVHPLSLACIQSQVPFSLLFVFVHQALLFMVVVATSPRDKQHAIFFLFTVEIHQRFNYPIRTAPIQILSASHQYFFDRAMYPGRRILLLAVLQLLTRATPTFAQGEL